jgi:hypothetical protein
MLRPFSYRFIIAFGAVLTAICLVSASLALGDPNTRQPDPKAAARAHWESVVIWFGDEETGEWSLRIRDEDVHARGWFEFTELWHFNRETQAWEEIKVEKFARAIVLPQQKTSDQPKTEQTLVELKDIEPQTAGLWFAKWKIDDVPCTTLMKVGGARPKNKLDPKSPGPGLVSIIVPIDLNTSEWAYIPDPRIFCVSGGPGKPGQQAGKK